MYADSGSIGDLFHTGRPVRKPVYNKLHDSDALRSNQLHHRVTSARHPAVRPLSDTLIFAR